MSRFARLVLVLALVALGCGRAQGGALQVSPLGVRLSDQQPIATLRLRNVGDRQVIMQAGVFAWTQPDGEDAYTATDEIVVIPPIFSLAPGTQQLLRVGLPEAMPSSQVERAFRLFLQELQPSAKGGSDQLSFSLRIGLPIFVPPTTDAHAGDLLWNLVAAEQAPLALRVSNRSAEHVKITAVRFLSPDGSLADEVRLLRYCLSGADATIALPEIKSAEQASHIQVVFKSGDRNKIDRVVLTDGAPAIR